MMTQRRFPSAAAFALAALLSTSAAAPAAAELPRPTGPIGECLVECAGLGLQCVRGCNAAFNDCVRGAKLEMRVCRNECAEQFEEETPEFEACTATCRQEILVPAREECGPLRRECVSQCWPGPCLRICGPRGDGVGEVDECRAGCAGELRSCAKAGKAALRECLAPCRSLTDEVERHECFAACAQDARAGAAACREEYRSCSAGCDEAVTTTTLPQP